MKEIIIAITGPSGIGKTTLGNKLKEKNGFMTPIHSTTRAARADDEKGFYRYLSHDEFNYYVRNKQFLFWSGDNEIVDIKYGNYYGVLNKDYDKLKNEKKIIIFISYKDINRIYELIKNGYNIKIVNLVYSDIEKNMPFRLNNSNIMHSPDDIKRRIKCAIDYEKKYGYIMSSYDILKLYGDILDSEQVYDEIVKKLIRK